MFCEVLEGGGGYGFVGRNVSYISVGWIEVVMCYIKGWGCVGCFVLVFVVGGLTYSSSSGWFGFGRGSFCFGVYVEFLFLL